MSLPGIPGYAITDTAVAQRLPPPSPWSSRFVHHNTCVCERCAHLQVNGCAPKEER